MTEKKKETCVKIPNVAICKVRRRHDWKLLMATYHWEWWSCEDCPAIKKVRPKGW